MLAVAAVAPAVGRLELWHQHLALAVGQQRRLLQQSQPLQPGLSCRYSQPLPPPPHTHTQAARTAGAPTCGMCSHEGMRLEMPMRVAVRPRNWLVILARHLSRVASMVQLHWMAGSFSHVVTSPT